jgi:hypothetical protein
MFCPRCCAEYREGFARCSDCEVDLLDGLPARSPRDSNVPENERPDSAKTPVFLAWFLPMALFYLLILSVGIRPSLFESPYIATVIVIGILVQNLGALWMIYQSVRYERKVGRYALMAFVPFMFIWYSLVRVPLRDELNRDPDVIR